MTFNLIPIIKYINNNFLYFTTMYQTIIGLISLICAVWVIYDVWAVNKKKTTGIKVLWTVLAIFFSIITAIVYYFLEKRK